MANEKKTEKLVTDALRAFGYYDDPQIHVEEQQSDIPRIDKLLKNASKSGMGKGYPEFIIHSDKYSDFIIVVECKPDTKKHESDTRKKYTDYAVDGVLLYASYLAKEYNVIAIAVSGETEKEVQITHFMHLKGQSKELPIFGNKLLSFSNYYNGYSTHQVKFNQDYIGLLKYSEQLNTTLHTYKISEADRAFFISGVLIALQDKAFKNSYIYESTAASLTNNLIGTIKTQLYNSSIAKNKIENIESQFLFIKGNITFADDKSKLIDLITEINTEVNSFMRTYQYFDTLGRFYTEFLRYANNDSGLGIVLTPSHVTDLFCDLADITENSIVLDNCAGTGGFLISAMRRMIELANGNEEKIADIKKKQIVGIEIKPNIYSLCVTNMIIHGDGKTSIFHDSCFSSIGKVKTNYSPTIGFLNPPYKADKKNDTEELEFVLNNLEMLEQNGKCVCIVPVSSALAQSGKGLEVKKRLRDHTLEAVMSMPDQLFYPIGAVTCIMVFTAKRPHPKGKKTWFGYWKDDGFLISKNKRIDIKNRWDAIRQNWIEAYVNREAVVGHSVTKEVSAGDEWCPEAYMETDYSLLKEQDFRHAIKNYVAYRYINDLISSLSEVPSWVNGTKIEILDTQRWGVFSLQNLFEIKKGKRLTKNDMTPGETPFIGARDNNNGVSTYIGREAVFKRNTITVNYDGNGVAESYYQPTDYWALDSVNVLYPKFKLNQYIAMFLVTIIQKEKFRFSYGRKWHMERMKQSVIRLPIDSTGNPDWQFMETYIKSLPDSANL